MARQLDNLAWLQASPVRDGSLSAAYPRFVNMDRHSERHSPDAAINKSIADFELGNFLDQNRQPQQSMWHTSPSLGGGIEHSLSPLINVHFATCFTDAVTA